ncbi:hypothetical protein G6F70_009414 [Rhizopus microsporus]|nr:hypothetical protein G6F71_009421 [Rhizopus microsporus]KAG1190176.1 hypothetical protein G6F70_009414 [Rhizopus microsporus]KAG1252569.1 hypothetical protein G6F68_011728 [Rhizopus microsporus]
MSLLDLEEDQEQLSLLMLKVDPEADSGQNLLSISRSFLAFVLWTLDAKDIIFEQFKLGIMLQAGISPAAQLLPDPPQYLKYLLASTDTQGRYFKDNLRQYNAAFAFTFLGCNIVSAEDRANSNSNSNNNKNRGGLNAFQIHDALCHRQNPLIPVEGSESSYA